MTKAEKEFRDHLAFRLETTRSLLKLSPDESFETILKEITLVPAPKTIASKIPYKKILRQYSKEIFGLLCDYARCFSEDNKNALEKLCLEILVNGKK